MRATRKLIGLWLQQGLASHIAQAQTAPASTDDAEKIIRQLVDLKPMFISQAELLHGPPNSPIAIGGLGWCDGINGFAAMVLSHEFPRSEVVGVVDRQHRGGHSFGRVWSKQYGDWLYFDLWTDEVVVFRSRPGQNAEFLARARPLGSRTLPTESPDVFRRMYANAHSGFTQYRLQPTLGGYLSSRLQNVLWTGTTSPQDTLDAIADASTIALPNDPRIRPPTGPVATADYARARLHHLMGDRERARQAYRQVVATDTRPISAYGLGAQIFLKRLRGPAATN